MDDFKDRVAVITGAAGGLGREFANVAAGLGMKLVLADVDVAGLERAAAELQSDGTEVLAMVCDVRKSTHVEELADAAMARFHGVHLLLNNAGVGAGGLIWENSVADWEWVLGVNLWGVIHGVRLFTPLMLECARRESGYQGHIVNTASMAGLLNAPAMGVYNVSKHAVVALSETLYHDLRLIDAPVHASVLCPYFVPTGIDRSERHRPDEVKSSEAPTASQQAAQLLVSKAVGAGKVSAGEVARMTFEAIRANRFWIYSHPHALGPVAERMDAIVHAGAPPDPYAATPEIADMLRAHLRAQLGKR
jgi:NAD(P)-dependent dehydrogenase (short-subunit alcohol dehydrogenase family)